MDNATNLELNLDKPVSQWVFRVRLSREEMEAIRTMCTIPHSDDQVRVEMVTLLALCDDFLRMSSADSTVVTMLHKSLVALCTMAESVALAHRNDGNTFRLVEEIFYSTRAILDRARQDAVPEK